MAPLLSPAPLDMAPPAPSALGGVARAIHLEHATVMGLKGRGPEYGRRVLFIGLSLLHVKSRLRHGELLPWVDEHAGVGRRSAQCYMRFAQRLIARSSAPWAASAKANRGSFFRRIESSETALRELVAQIDLPAEVSIRAVARRSPPAPAWPGVARAFEVTVKRIRRELGKESARRITQEQLDRFRRSLETLRSALVWTEQAAEVTRGNQRG